ncbi:MAG TPA: zf-HC2 domain-containing protein [Chthoniobacterales bacterium]|nr:zf-HC2 domain-containing protein [Chthoniobacterales bacterium]
MNCEEADRLMDAYLDGVLELTRQIEIERHLTRCRDCQSLAQQCQEFRSFFSANAPNYKAPPELRARILAMVPDEKVKHAFRFWREPWVYATAAAAVVLLALCVALTILFPDNGKEFSGVAVLDHSRSLAANHLVDVASADLGVVRPWLTAKLDFYPPVVDLPGSGYLLVGGRIDIIRNRPVAAVVYKQKGDVVTLFCWPVNRDLVSNGNYLIQGYHVCTWSNAQCNYIAVSKLDSHELDQFADLFRDHLQSNPY